MNCETVLAVVNKYFLYINITLHSLKKVFRLCLWNEPQNLKYAEHFSTPISQKKNRSSKKVKSLPSSYDELQPSSGNVVILAQFL